MSRDTAEVRCGYRIVEALPLSRPPPTNLETEAGEERSDDPAEAAVRSLVVRS